MMYKLILLFIAGLFSFLHAGGIDGNAKVLTVYGLLPAQDIKPGFQVYSLEGGTQLTQRPIVKISQEEHKFFYRVTLVANDLQGRECKVFLAVAPHQSLFSPSRKQWVRVCDLDPGKDSICINYNQEFFNYSIELEHTYLTRMHRKMYFFEVNETGMFFATELLIPLHNTAFLVVPPLMIVGEYAAAFATTVALACLQATISDVVLDAVLPYAQGNGMQGSQGESDKQSPIPGGDGGGDDPQGPKEPKDNGKKAAGVALSQEARKRYQALRENKLKTSVPKHDKPANSMMGKRGNDLGDSTLDSNLPTTIRGQSYTGHAVDRMQGRGVVPSVVEETISKGVESPGKKPGTIDHYDFKNDVTVVTSKQSGAVVTVHYGGG